MTHRMLLRGFRVDPARGGERAARLAPGDARRLADKAAFYPNVSLMAFAGVSKFPGSARTRLGWWSARKLASRAPIE